MSTTGGIYVLHVDDNQELADVSAAFLEREHDRITVQTAASPSDGLQLLADQDVDCIISDYDMPRMNGIDFLDAVREQHPELPFILYTGKGSEEIASDAISAGVTDYLQKESGSSQYKVLANRVSNAVERYRSRQAVEETEQKLSELAERTDDVLFMFNEDWSELLFINSAYEDIWGGSIDELEEDPQSFLELVHPEDRDDARASMEQLLTGNSEQLEYRIVRPDGEYRWVRGDTQPIRDDDGNTVRIVDQVRDITEQKKRESHLETIIGNLPGYVYRHKYDSEYPLKFVKGDAETITGYTATELEEEVVRAEEIIHPDDREDLWAEHIAGLEATGWFDSTYRIITKDGDVRWIRDQGQLIEDSVTDEEVIEGFITDVSDRIQREQLIQDQQMLIDESVDVLQDIFYVINEDGDLVRWNERLPAVSGYTDEELDEMNAVALFTEEHRERITASVEETMESGSSVVRADILTADGERLPFELRGTRLTDSYQGETVGVGIGRDISEQVQREQELERVRDFFEEAERLGNLGAWEFNENGAVVWTEGTRRIHEVDTEFVPTLEDAIGFFHPKDRDTIERVIETALQTGESFDEELRLITAEGDQRWVRTRGKVLTDEEPQTVRGFIQDITEQKERERELQQTTARLEVLFEDSPDMINVHDIEGTILDANTQLCEETGYSEEELIGMKVWDIDHMISSDEAHALWAGMEVGERRGVEGVFQRRDGSTFPVKVHIRRLDRGEGDRFAVISRDISEQKEREQNLQQERDRLDEFASVVSHDIRSPLSIAGGHLDLLREECDSEHIDPIDRAITRMDSLSENLLTLARGGDYVSETEAVDLAELSERCWRNAETANATLRTRSDRTLRADRNRLTQLLENLIRNAVEHGGDDVTVTVGEVTDGFYVEDSGPGIPEDEREDVFDAGYSTTEDGIGFGLSIVNQIVEGHGWEIRSTESPDGGARFEITGVEFTE